MKVEFFFWFELASFLVSVLVFRRIMNTQLVLFVPYLFFIVVYEYGTRQGWFTIGESNHIIANAFLVIEFLFYTVFFSKLFESKKIKLTISWGFIMLMLFYAFNLLYLQKVKGYNSYTILFGSLLLITWSCLVFYRLVTRPLELNPLRYPIFWISAGVLFFYLLRFPFFAYFEYMAYAKDMKYVALFITITNISIGLLYSCIAIGLLCCRPPIQKL
jgi:hypothetical protein